MPRRFWKHESRKVFQGRFEDIVEGKIFRRNLFSFDEMNVLLEPHKGSRKRKRVADNYLEDKWWETRLQIINELRVKTPIEEQVGNAPLLDEAINIWSNRLDYEGKAEQTIRDYKTSMLFWVEGNGNIPVDLYLPTHDENFLRYLKGRGVSKNTVKKHTRHVSVFWRFAKKKGWLKDQPDFEGVLGEDVEPDPYTIQEMESLLRYWVKTNNKPAFRMTVMLSQTGLRSSEIRNLKLKDINLVEKEMIIRFSKGRKKGKKAGLSETLLSFIKMDRRNPSEIYFTDDGYGRNRWRDASHVAKHFRDAWNALGVYRRQPVHGFRSFVATFTLGKSGDLYRVKNLMGHSSTSVTEGYISDARQVSESRELINKTINKSINIPVFGS